MLNINQLSRLAQTGPKALRALVHKRKLRCHQSRDGGKMLFLWEWWVEYLDRWEQELQTPPSELDEVAERLLAKVLRKAS